MGNLSVEGIDKVEVIEDNRGRVNECTNTFEIHCSTSDRLQTDVAHGGTRFEIV